MKACDTALALVPFPSLVVKNCTKAKQGADYGGTHVPHGANCSVSCAATGSELQSGGDSQILCRRGRWVADNPPICGGESIAVISLLSYFAYLAILICK